MVGVMVVHRFVTHRRSSRALRHDRQWHALPNSRALAGSRTPQIQRAWLSTISAGQAFGVLVRRAGAVAERLDFVSLSRARPGMVAFWLHLLAKQKVEEKFRQFQRGDGLSR